jgi:hypothetical protein
MYFRVAGKWQPGNEGDSGEYCPCERDWPLIDELGIFESQLINCLLFNLFL